MKHFSSPLKGYTLIEVVVSLALFTILMSGVAQTFAKVFSGYHSSRSIQQDLENAQYFVGIMAKELRTSSIVSPAAGPFPNNAQYVQFYDHSQGKCFRYRIQQGTMQLAQAAVANVAACAAQVFVNADFTAISTGIVSGSFRVTPSTTAPTVPMRVGKVTVSLDVSEVGTHHVYIQTSVSLRDFGNIGL